MSSKSTTVASTAAALPGERQSRQSHLDDKVSDSLNISSLSDVEDDAERDDKDHLHLSVNNKPEKKLQSPVGDEKVEKNGTRGRRGDLGRRDRC